MKFDLNDEKIFIAGSTGMVGSSIKRFLKNKLKAPDQNLLTPSRKELDLTNIEKVNLWFKKNKPTVVIIAAAKVGGIYANKKKPAQPHEGQAGPFFVIVGSLIASRRAQQGTQQRPLERSSYQRRPCSNLQGKPDRSP